MAYDPFRRYREVPGAIGLVRDFWYWRRQYDWCRTRSVAGTARAEREQLRAVAGLAALGFFPEGGHERMPTLDEAEGRLVGGRPRIAPPIP